MNPSKARAAALLALLAFTAACAGWSARGASPNGGSPAPVVEAVPGPASPPPRPLNGELTVFAAASLTEAFAAIAQAFSHAHPEVDVLLNLAGSQRLASQVLQGAPADVLATADRAQLAAVVEAGLIRGQPQAFATNSLQIAVEPGNPLGIVGLADLTRGDIVVVLAAPAVPAGRYAAEALATAGVTATPASLETDVRGVVAKVRLGEADAGIVYRSDVQAADGDVEGVALPAASDVVAVYPIAPLGDAPNPAAAEAFVDFVTSPEAQRILRDHGFGPAP